ncbi:Uncharacterised protein [[Flavobacterium] thermophilum]|jgi:hypothetical protein|nr:Uncharacterised protein [[Flavobacterium] thermophilum]
MNFFNDLYEKYKNKVKMISGDLVETSKADFIKLFAFYELICEEKRKQLRKQRNTYQIEESNEGGVTFEN